VARKFLYAIAVLIGLVIIAGITWAIFGDRLMRVAFVPSAPFVEQRPVAPNVYDAAGMWYARPDIAANPAQWLPPGFPKAQGDRPAAVFFIHPTSYLDRSAWNAPLDDARSADLAQTFIRGQATAFNGVGDIWAPKYRQATFGSFLTTQAEAQRALDAAYGDVATAFAAFVAAIPADRPIILAGHSQGALHLTRLLREKVAGKPIARRIVAAYVVGWPVSVETDVKALGLPACATANQPNCLLSWESFAEPADPKLVTETFDATMGFDGRPRRGTHLLCTNPVTGVPNTAATAAQNLGTLVPDADLKNAVLATGKVPARCDSRGFLLIGAPPEDIRSYVLPGNNYHVFDYSLFWANVRADAARRLAAFMRERRPA
jgi:hypothetical protein